MKIWNTAFEYLDACAYESDAMTVSMHLTTDALEGTSQSHELFKRLAERGARITKEGTLFHAEVPLKVAQQLMHDDLQPKF